MNGREGFIIVFFLFGVVACLLSYAGLSGQLHIPEIDTTNLFYLGIGALILFIFVNFIMSLSAHGGDSTEAEVSRYFNLNKFKGQGGTIAGWQEKNGTRHLQLTRDGTNVVVTQREGRYEVNFTSPTGGRKTRNIGTTVDGGTVGQWLNNIFG